MSFSLSFFLNGSVPGLTHQPFYFCSCSPRTYSLPLNIWRGAFHSVWVFRTQDRGLQNATPLCAKYHISLRTCLDDTHENGEQQLTGTDFEKKDSAHIFFRVLKGEKRSLKINSQFQYCMSVYCLTTPSLQTKSLGISCNAPSCSLSCFLLFLSLCINLLINYNIYHHYIFIMTIIYVMTKIYINHQYIFIRL